MVAVLLADVSDGQTPKPYGRRFGVSFRVGAHSFAMAPPDSRAHEL